MIAGLAPRATIHRRIERAERCCCPECLQLDRRHVGEGYQLAMFAFRPGERAFFQAADRRRRYPA